MEELLERFVRGSVSVLGDALTGVYLHGSAAMGCYRPDRSDLDLLTVVRRPLSDAVKRAYMDMVPELDAAGPAKGIEMSVVTEDAVNPFVYPTPFLLHWSRAHAAWYRRDPEDYIRRMNGTDPDLAAHCTVIRRRGRCLWGAPVESVFGEVPEEAYVDSLWGDVSGAAEEIEANPVYLTLNLARVLAYLREGAVLSKREGGEWGLAHLPACRPLIEAALRDYAGGERMTVDPERSRRCAAIMLDEIAAERRRRTQGGTADGTV